MIVKLVKKQIVLNEGKQDEKKFFTFSLVLPNGNALKVQPNTYVGKDGKKQSNYKELSLIAEFQDEDLPF